MNCNGTEIKREQNGIALSRGTDGKWELFFDAYCMYSMPYYTYGSTANFLFLGPTARLYISKERYCIEDLRGVGKFKIE